MTWIHAVVTLALVANMHQAATGCKTSTTLGKAEKAMFLAHSDACLAQSRAHPADVRALLRGDLAGLGEGDEEGARALRRHVYCVLLKCKLIGKDGKLHKTALHGKMAARADAKNATKVLESCAELGGLTPEDVAWSLFRCGYDKKTILFNYMPTVSASSGEIENNSH